MNIDNEKHFDSVKMVREIREAMYRQSTDLNFDVKEFDEIKIKWEKLLEQEIAHKQVFSKAS